MFRPLTGIFFVILGAQSELEQEADQQAEPG